MIFTHEQIKGFLVNEGVRELVASGKIFSLYPPTLVLVGGHIMESFPFVATKPDSYSRLEENYDSIIAQLNDTRDVIVPLEARGVLARNVWLTPRSVRGQCDCIVSVASTLPVDEDADPSEPVRTFDHDDTCPYNVIQEVPYRCSSLVADIFEAEIRTFETIVIAHPDFTPSPCERGIGKYRPFLFEPYKNWIDDDPYWGWLKWGETALVPSRCVPAIKEVLDNAARIQRIRKSLVALVATADAMDASDVKKQQAQPWWRRSIGWLKIQVKLPPAK